MMTIYLRIGLGNMAADYVVAELISGQVSIDRGHCWQ